MAFFPSRNTPALRLGGDRWRSVTGSYLFGKYPFDSTYCRIVSNSGVESRQCTCTANCFCHSQLVNFEITPPCPCDAEGRECVDCDGCKAADSVGLPNCSQIHEKGSVLSAGEVKYINDEWGYGFFANQDIVSGKLIGCFEGVVKLRQDAKSDDIYTFGFSNSFRIILIADTDARIPEKKTNWVIDASEMGTQLNFINTTCNNNNVTAYTVWVSGIPKLGFYANKNIKKGLSIHCVLFVLYIKFVLICQAAK